MDFKLKSYLLAIKDLLDIYSGEYIKSILSRVRPDCVENNTVYTQGS
jgi:hypothetical protein